MTNRRHPGFWVLATGAIAAWTLFVYWPFFEGYYFLDDYAFITIARYTDNPVLYFSETHFPGGLFYRPAGMLLWWLIGAIDPGMQTQFVANWLLLVAAATLFLAVLIKAGLPRWPSLIVALLFCTHPVSTMTAGWLSNRFDLLASLGMFLALLGALRWFKGSADRRALMLVACGTLVAVTSKETGLITPLVILVLALSSGDPRVRYWPLWISGFVAAMYLLVRQALTTGADSLLLQEGAAHALVQGVRVWLVRAPEFLLRTPEAGSTVALALLFVAVLLFCAALLRLTLSRGTDVLRKQSGAVVFLLGLVIVATTIVIQFPSVSNSILAKHDANEFDSDHYLAARFFYFGLIGALMMLAGSVSMAIDWARLRNIATGRTGGVARMTAAMAVMLLLWFHGDRSREQGIRWVQLSGGNNAVVARAAAEAISMRVPENPENREACRFYLLGTQDFAPTFWFFSDTAVKASVSSKVALQLGRCMISTESTPWYHVLRAAPAGSPAELPQTGPLLRTCSDGVPIKPQAFATVEIHFMSYPHSGAILRPASGDRVLSYDIERSQFVDVTDQVAAGDRQVKLKWSRLEQNRCVDNR